MTNEYVYLNNKDLRISPDIQRKLNPSRVARIAANYSPSIANPIKVSYRDGKYFIFDGMHTRAALCTLKGTEDFLIPCRVYNDLTKEDEARLFAAQFGYSESVKMIDRLRALEVAKDPEVLEFLHATRGTKLKIDLNDLKGRNGQLVAVCEAFKAFQTLGADQYSRMLKLLLATWAGESWSLCRYMVGGMAKLITQYDFKNKAFVKAFREVGQKEIQKMVDRFPGMTKNGAYASALAEIFEQRNTKLALR